MNNTFTVLLKKEFIDNRRSLLLGLTGILVSYILLGIFIGNTMQSESTEVEIILFLFMGAIIIIIGASLAFSNMKTKEDRINTLMIPAPMSQKFIIRWLATVPMLLLIVLVASLLGDWARVVTSSINGKDTVNLITYIGNCYSIEEEVNKVFICAAVTALLCQQAIYFLGSILWPKLSFIKTLAAIQILQFLLAILFFCVRWGFSFSSDWNIGVDGLTWIVYTFDLLFCSIIYWLAYVRFKRSQVIYKLF